MPILGQGFRIIAVDLPGQGDSDKPLDGYDTQTVARRLHELVEHLGLKRYGLVAHDVGAWVAFPYAMMFDKEIEALAMLDAGISGITLPEMLPSASDRSWKTWHFSFHAVPDLREILLWTCHGLVPDHGLSVKRRCAHDPEGFSIELRNAASEDYRNH